MGYYAVGLTGLNLLYQFPWKDFGQKFRAMCSGGGQCLPEDIDLDIMNSTAGSKCYHNSIVATLN